MSNVVGNFNFKYKGEIQMIDFKNGSTAYTVLKMVDNESYSQLVSPFFVTGEEIIGTYKGMRDGVVFTNKRIIAINVQGLTGKKKDFTSIPYSKIQAFAVETAGVLDLDSELEICISGLGTIKFDFSADTNISSICKVISEQIL